jgi:hypothetical protein
VTCIKDTTILISAAPGVLSFYACTSVRDECLHSGFGIFIFTSVHRPGNFVLPVDLVLQRIGTIERFLGYFEIVGKFPDGLPGQACMIV